MVPGYLEAYGWSCVPQYPEGSVARHWRRSTGGNQELFWGLGGRPEVRPDCSLIGRSPLDWETPSLVFWGLQFNQGRGAQRAGLWLSTGEQVPVGIQELFQGVAE